MWTKLFDQFAHTIARLSGKPLAFGLACLLVLAWAVTGPAFGFSQTWQIVINTGTTIGDTRLRTTATPAFTKA